MPSTGVSPELQVHVLSEYVFCPRACVLARASGEDQGDEEPNLGARLDGYVDYDAKRFAEALHAAWTEIGHWLTCLAPALLLVLVSGWFVSAYVALYLSLPVFYVLVRLWNSSRWLLEIARAEARYASAAPFSLEAVPDTIQEVNWWSLRKAGFDCRKPQDAHRDPADRLCGKPWRILTHHNAIRIPVVRKHRGDRTWGPQHVVRLAAYCRLLERCEGATSPFGVLLFADSDECIVFPNTAGPQFQLEQALASARELLQAVDSGRFIPPAPGDNRCSGCPFGKPREFIRGETDTVLDGQAIPAVTVPRPGKHNQRFHSACGDRFQWTPPHRDAVALKIAEPRPTSGS